MILDKRDIKKVLREVTECLAAGSDTAICKDGLTRPEDIEYRSGDIALPIPFLPDEDTSNKMSCYDAALLQETLLLVKDGKLPGYLQKVGTVADNVRLIDIGSIVKKRLADQRLRRNRLKKLRGHPNNSVKGRRR